MNYIVRCKHCGALRMTNKKPNYDRRKNDFVRINGAVIKCSGCGKPDGLIIEKGG